LRLTFNPTTPPALGLRADGLSPELRRRRHSEQETAMWFLSSRKSRRTATARCCRACRPRVEWLEDRCQPSAGVLDPTFGTGGQATLSWNGRIGDIVVQPDGKLVVCGFTGTGTYQAREVTRLNANGSIDVTFGTSGTWGVLFTLNHWQSTPLIGHIA